MPDILDIALAHSSEAKRLLGQFITDKVVADRIVECIIVAAMLEITAAQSGIVARKEGQ